MAEKKHCINCDQELVKRNGIWLCRNCNSKDLELSNIFNDEPGESEYIFIECPGATLYKDGTDEIIQGVKFHDREDPQNGYDIIDKPVYAPTHKRRRRIKKESVNNICRCQGCQDYTIRMRRREGADFFIPSTKYPGRKKLKTVEHVAYEP